MIQTYDPSVPSDKAVKGFAEAARGAVHLVAAVDESGRQVAIGVGSVIEDDRYSLHGAYISRVYVASAVRAEGYGFAVVAELLRLFIADGHDTVYLIRPEQPGRVFEGGFGFVKVEGAEFPTLTSNAALFVASPPDPDWVPGR